MRQGENTFCHAQPDEHRPRPRIETIATDFSPEGRALEEQRFQSRLCASAAHVAPAGPAAHDRDGRIRSQRGPSANKRLRDASAPSFCRAASTLRDSLGARQNPSREIRRLRRAIVPNGERHAMGVRIRSRELTRAHLRSELLRKPMVGSSARLRSINAAVSQTFCHRRNPRWRGGSGRSRIIAPLPAGQIMPLLSNAGRA